MRSGGCAVQQALTAEAGAVVRQAVALARRRGHAQVTPLHVASAMLSPAPAGGLLRAACLRAHSHPLQCKALELCFNVALNRLPTTGPAAAVVFHGGGHHGGYGGAHAPVLSNALVAAFKRAQAHQRRGGGAAEPPPPQPPAVVAASSSKVELEQLVVSILDDPSVSRVMREAGFSSSQVKANVEKAIAVSSSSSPLSEHHPSTNTTASSSPTSGHPSSRRLNDDEDVVRVLDSMAGGGGSGSKRRCAVVVVGESAEGVVKAVMDRVSKGELGHRHERLKNLQFVPLSAASFRGMTRDEVDARVGDLRALVRQGCAAGKGVVLVLEDLAYASEAWAAASERRNQHGNCSYCPVEHGVMEVSSLASAAAAGRGLDRFWLLGFGNNQAYIKCRAGQPSLEAVWELQPVVVPDGGGAVALSLSCTSSDPQQASQERSRTGWPSVNGAAADGSHRIDCAEATPNLPQWLRGYQDSDQNGPESCTTSLQLQEWNHNRNGSAAHPTSEPTLTFSLVTATTLRAPSSTSGLANNTNTNMTLSCKPCQFMPMQPWLMNHRYGDRPIMANSYDHQTLHSNPNPESYSVSSSSESGAAVQPKFTELTAENLKILCNTLENCVPRRHKDMVADIASTVLQCRSGMARRRMRKHGDKPSMATWLLFHGRDNDGKKAVAQELARLLFGSYAKFTSILLSNYTQVHSRSSSGEIVLKRQRSMDNGHSHVQQLYDAVHENPHQVIMIDGVDQLECESEIRIRSAISNGKIASCNGDEMSLEDVIIILSCEALDNSRSSSCYSPRLKQRAIDTEGDEGSHTNIEKETEPSCFILDLNACAEDGEGDEGSASSDIMNIVDGVFLFQSTEDL